jgi:hypothetical protein
LITSVRRFFAGESEQISLAGVEFFVTAGEALVFTFGWSDEEASWPSRHSLAIASGLCAQTGLLLATFGHLVIAGLLVMLSSTAWTLLFSSYSGWSRQQTRWQILRWSASVVLTTTYLLLLQASHGTGSFGIQLGRHLSSRSARSTKYHQARYKALSPADHDFHDAYAGIVLWPKKQSYTKLIAPPPRSFEEKLFNRSRENPLTIPFDGVYWFYRAPDSQPPPKARQAQGSPESFDINSTDVRPLSMEARQNLGTSVDLSCCSRIQIAIRNADRFLSSVSLELVIIDTASQGRPSLSLGRVFVSSDPSWRFQEHISPSTQILNFPVPASGAISHFDEMMIVFHLEGYRARAAAKVGIDHFTLVPRGL